MCLVLKSPSIYQDFQKLQINSAFCAGVSHTLAAHRLGQEYVNTGTKPIPALEYPSYGAVVSKERPVEPEIPNVVAVPRASQGPGFLGIR